MTQPSVHGGDALHRNTWNSVTRSAEFRGFLYKDQQNSMHGAGDHGGDGAAGFCCEGGQGAPA